MATVKKKKLNAVDIVIILLVLAIGVGGFFVLRSRNEIVNSGGMKTITYTVEGQNVVENAANMPKIGDEVYNSSTSEFLGTLTDVKVEPQKRIAYNNTKGVYEKYDVPGLFTVYVTISGDGFDTEKDITVNGTVTKVGKELSVKGKGYAFMGYIVGVNLGE